MGDGRAARLLRNAEGVAYWGAVAPVLAHLNGTTKGAPINYLMVSGNQGVMV